MKSTQGAGISLIIGSFLMIITMVLHPVGGDFQHLVVIIPMGIISHSIAILSLPFTAYGFFGLTKRLQTSPFFANTAFSIMAFGLIAAMLAASINGLILMDFVGIYAEADDETISAIKPFLLLLRAFNHAYDFIMIGAVLLSMLFWSIAILQTKSLSIWLGYLGALLAIIALILILADFMFVDLFGFRIFIFGWVVWVIYVGLEIRKQPSVES